MSAKNNYSHYQENDFSDFVLCGFYYNTKKRFSLIYKTFSQANQINMWKGNMYGVLKSTGKRVKLKSVIN